jgi:hypothetical protein
MTSAMPHAEFVVRTPHEQARAVLRRRMRRYLPAILLVGLLAGPVPVVGPTVHVARFAVCQASPFC